MNHAEILSNPPAPAPIRPTRVDPSTLPTSALARRLAELCGDERNVQVDFLLHLAEFDHRRVFAGSGYPSLWAYCTQALHLREGAAWRRIEAMKLLRRFPSLQAPLRSGALCLSTVNLLGSVLTEENVADVAARAAFLSKIETERLVAAISPRDVPADGLRKLPARAEPQALALVEAARPTTTVPAADARRSEAMPAPLPTASALGSERPLSAPVSGEPTAVTPPPRLELRPVAQDAWSLRVTLDDAARAELLELAALTAHASGGDLATVLRDAVRCALEKHRKRRGAARPERARKPASAAPDRSKCPDPRAVPMAVRQEVWERDGGRCAFVSPDGKRCGSAWKLQLGHVRPVALGGQATVEDLRLECEEHNLHEAIRVFGRRHMARFRPGLDSRRRE